MAQSGSIDSAEAFLNRMNYLHIALADDQTEQLAGPMAEFAAHLRNMAGTGGPGATEEHEASVASTEAAGPEPQAGQG
eukprot:994331-Pyramimonas_sp.AAC.1